MDLESKYCYFYHSSSHITQDSDFQLFLVWNFSYLFVFSSIELYDCVLETTNMDGLLLRSLQIIE
jgi:hypothetical protein